MKFDGLARAAGGARVRMVATLGAETDAFEMPLRGDRSDAAGDNGCLWGDERTTRLSGWPCRPALLSGVGG